MQIRNIAHTIADDLATAKKLCVPTEDAAVTITRTLNRARTAKFYKNQLDQAIDAIGLKIQDGECTAAELIKLVKEQKSLLEMGSELAEKRQKNPQAVARAARRKKKSAEVAVNDPKLKGFDNL